MNGLGMLGLVVWIVVFSYALRKFAGAYREYREQVEWEEDYDSRQIWS